MIAGGQAAQRRRNLENFSTPPKILSLIDSGEVLIHLLKVSEVRVSGSTRHPRVLICGGGEAHSAFESSVFRCGTELCPNKVFRDSDGIFDNFLPLLSS